MISNSLLSSVHSFSLCCSRLRCVQQWLLMLEIWSNHISVRMCCWVKEIFPEAFRTNSAGLVTLTKWQWNCCIDQSDFELVTLGPSSRRKIMLAFRPLLVNGICSVLSNLHKVTYLSLHFKAVFSNDNGGQQRRHWFGEASKPVAAGEIICHLFQFTNYSYLARNTTGQTGLSELASMVREQMLLLELKTQIICTTE